MLQEQEQRHIYYDRDLQIEAYNLSGIVQKFPNHFHEYYVIGFVEGGMRHLYCRGQEYDVEKGDMVLFNPHDTHSCAPLHGEILDYRAINIKPEIMLKATKTIMKKEYMPRFDKNVVMKSTIAPLIKTLYDTILNQANYFEKKEAFHTMLTRILKEYTTPYIIDNLNEVNEQIQKLCCYMEEHFAENISLDDLLSMTHFGKNYLLRIFTRQLGVSPYRYLQTIRLDRAKNFLEEGIMPADVAVMSGFNDQSHFTKFFKEFIGVTPKQYQRIFYEDEKEGAL